MSSDVTDGDTLHIIETSQESEPVVYDPYPDYNGAAWKAKWKGEYRQCMGPTGTALDKSNKDLLMKGYNWNVSSTDIKHIDGDFFD